MEAGIGLELIGSDSSVGSILGDFCGNFLVRFVDKPVGRNVLIARAVVCTDDLFCSARWVL